MKEWVRKIREKEATDRASHKQQLEKEHGLTGHPKADKLYALAWDMGHSSGYEEVATYYGEMAELLKD